MRKTALILAVILVLTIVTVPAIAAEPKIAVATPKLTFNGTTATCDVNVAGDHTSDKLAITVKLWNNNTCVATWTASGNGYIIFSRTKAVVKGATYKLTVDLTINGVSQPQAYVAGTC